MKKTSSPRLSFRQLGYGLWGLGLLWLLGLIAIPIGNELTRFASACLFGALVLGALMLVWRWRLFFWVLAGIVIATGLFMMLPARAIYNRDELRREVASAIRRYEGVRYFGGGEGFWGIDSAGLIRRGLIEGTFLYGLHTFDPGFLRKSIWIWWHDMSAKEMSSGAFGLAHRRMASSAGIVRVNDSTLVPGDFAITSDGIHALAYVGNHTWLEADPEAKRVIRVPDGRNPGANVWFRKPVRLMRWRLLDPEHPVIVH